MPGTASARLAAGRPRSLVQRLALLGSADGREAESERTGEGPGAGAYFGMGLAGGAVTGAVVLLGLQAAAYFQLDSAEPRVPPAIAALAPWVSEPSKSIAAEAAPVIAREPQADAFDMFIDRGARASAPFGLHLVGSEDAAMQVLLRDVPSTVLISRGERRDASTWAVSAGDLEDLRLTINDGAPDVFDVRIDVLAPPGVAAAGSVARVRLVDMPRPERTKPERSKIIPVDAPPPPPPESHAIVAKVDSPPVATRSSAISRRKHGVTTREKAAHASPAAVAPPAATPAAVETERHPAQTAPLETARNADEWHWPEGASGLGAVPRETDRQVWWKLPVPAWSPFKDTIGR